MKLSKLFASAILVICALAGCQIESAEQIDLTLKGTPKHFVAGFGSATRTAVDATGKTSWKAGDVIRYYSAAGGAIGEVAVTADCEKAAFTANVGGSASFFIAEYGGTGITNNTSGKSLTIQNAVQEVQTGRFEDAHVAVTKVYIEPGEQPQSLTFKNITSLIEFTLERADVAKVVFTATGKEILHGTGDVNISFKDVTPTPSFAGEGGSSITINTGGAGTFYISTLPVTLSDGFSIQCFDEHGASLGAAIGTKALNLGTGSIVCLGTIDEKIELLYEDLSADGTANCYIVSKPGDYKFNATVMGNSTTLVDGTPYKAEVLWESFGTDVAPTVGDIVSGVSYKGGYIRFTSGKDGNAVIAVKDRDDEIIWSWHIWVCDGYDPAATDQQYNNNAGIMMDRNLGATSATPGDVKALGLMYQWGRKDPFLSGNAISSTTSAASTIVWPSAVASNASNGTIDYAVKHPTVFITENSSNHDWYYTGSSSTDNTRWQSSKGMYDPCPPGYRVPDGGNSGVWAKAFGTSSNWRTSSNWDGTNKGMDFSKTDKKLGSGAIWCPASGCRSSVDGALSDVGTYGNYWSCTHYGSATYDMYFTKNGDAYPSDFYFRADCYSVRCLSESSPTIIPVTSVTISEASASMTVGDTKTLTATALPSDANVNTFNWSSSDESVATVDQNGKVTAVAPGSATITATAYNGVKGTCTVTVTDPVVATDLSATATANCYIVSEAGTYKFKAVKGNTNTSVGDVKGVKVLWESFGTNVAPTVGDIVKADVSYAGGYVIFNTNDTYKKGNAVIAAYSDAGCTVGNVLWSWHIWCTDVPADQVYDNSAGTMMDRNLGATSATPGDVCALGLLYQWGRKDPFLSSSSISNSTIAASTLSWPSAVAASSVLSGNNALNYSVSHPTTFIYNGSTPYDWYCTSSSNKNNQLWSATKSVYDPCPPGYRVPDGGSNGVWSKAFNYSNYWQTASNWDGTNKGMDFGKTDKKLGSGTIWYPASGYRYNGNGSLDYVGYYGVYWSCTPSSDRAYGLYFGYDGYVYPSNDYNRAYGYSVRCLPE